jgi:hypothetical protein
MRRGSGDRPATVRSRRPRRRSRLSRRREPPDEPLDADSASESALVDDASRTRRFRRRRARRGVSSSEPPELEESDSEETESLSRVWRDRRPFWSAASAALRCLTSSASVFFGGMSYRGKDP